ncbi:MAG: hypothetical protein JST42_14825 [Bacteroidetes bacterium]|nr:hypothetical protein [Bacteroidota bacterium]
MIPTLITLLLTGIFNQSQKIPPGEDVHAKLILGHHRSILAYAGSGHSFTFDIPYRSVKSSDVPGFVTIDRQIVQATIVPADKSLGKHPTGSDKEKDLLTRYMNFELSYYKKKLKQNYSQLSTEWLTIHGRTFLVWYFNMPGNYKLVSRQVYVSTLFDDQVVDLNAPVFKMDDWGKARSILVRIAGTMQTFDKHLDLIALENKLKK